MKTLIVEDEFTGRVTLLEFLRPYGETHVAVTGEEGLTAVDAALEQGAPYDLVCLDIGLPDMPGDKLVSDIRQIELVHGRRGAKVVMTTSSNDPQTILDTFKDQCDAYLVKPISHTKLIEQLKSFGLISREAVTAAH
jgi:two-component system chemotaxis response regulator CheY